MKLSIIIPVYNTEKYIGDCVKSIFEQGISHENFEIILVNDGSKDGSLNVCNDLSKKHSNVRVISQENKGQSSARNVGLKNSNGKYIYFIDSDDYLNSGYLSVFLDILEKNLLDFLGFENYDTSERYISTSKTAPLELGIQGSGLSIISQYPFYNGSCWYIFEKKLAEDIFFEEGHLCEDILFTTQLLLRVTNGRIYKNKIYGYYANSESTLRTKNVERLHKLNMDMFYVAEKFSEIINNTDFGTNTKGFHCLRARQESYTFFGIVRFIKNRRKYEELDEILNRLENCKHSGYPIKNFRRTHYIYKVLIRSFNNRVVLRSIIWLNRLVGLIK